MQSQQMEELQQSLHDVHIAMAGTDFFSEEYSTLKRQMRQIEAALEAKAVAANESKDQLTTGSAYDMPLSLDEEERARNFSLMPMNHQIIGTLHTSARDFKRKSNNDEHELSAFIIDDMKGFSEGEKAFLKKIAGPLQEEVIGASRVTIIKIKNIVLVTKYHVCIVSTKANRSILKGMRGGKIGWKLTNQINMLDIIEFQVQVNERKVYVFDIICQLENKGLSFRSSFREIQNIHFETIDSKFACALARHIYMTISVATFNHPVNTKPVFSIPEEILESVMLPDFRGVDGFKEAFACAYDAMCKKLQIEPDSDPLLQLSATVEEHNPLLDLSKCFDTPITSSELLYAFIWALRYINPFSSVDASGMKLKEQGMFAVSKLAPLVHSFNVSDTKASSNAMQHLGKRLGESHKLVPGKSPGVVSSLKELDVSNNRFGDAGIEALVSGLIKGGITLRVLKLFRTNVSQKGFKHLSLLLNQAGYLQEMSILDISKNDSGKTGSESLSSFLLRVESLTHFRAGSCGLDLSVIFEALTENPNQKLEVLTVRGNSKIDHETSQLLGRLLATTTTLSELDISKSKMTSFDCVETIFSAIFSNVNEIELNLNLSKNPMEASFASGLSLALQLQSTDAKSILTHLDISKCKLRAEELCRSCKALGDIKSLKFLALGRNVKVVDELVGQNLANLIQDIPNLRVLTVIGNSKHRLEGSLIPLIQELTLNESLICLDISGNAMDLNCYIAIRDALSVNSTICRLNVDRNGAQRESLELLKDGILANSSLLGWIPLQDISRAQSLTSRDARKLKKTLRNKFIENKSTQETKTDEFEHFFSGTLYMNLTLFQPDDDDDDDDEKSADEDEEEKDIIEDGEIDIGYFGVPYEILDKEFVDGYESEIPSILILMKNYMIESESYLTEGVFRKSPTKKEEIFVLKQLNSDSFESCSNVHTIPHLMKLWLRELPFPLLSELDIEKVRGESLEYSISRISEPRLSMFLWLIDLCVMFAEHEDMNRMSPNNIAIVMGPNLYDFENMDPLTTVRVATLLRGFISRMIIKKLETKIGSGI